MLLNTLAKVYHLQERKLHTQNGLVLVLLVDIRLLLNGDFVEKHGSFLRFYDCKKCFIGLVYKIGMGKLIKHPNTGAVFSKLLKVILNVYLS
jgi:hypothetical protein